ncbi:DUF4007 family protein [Planktotalea arctica]|jgi:hypothetical protein|uniref:DUF4007 family protein n=1 Tax=Planktotalea arctica TaxID=1481893 RepID=UPI00321A7321
MTVFFHGNFGLDRSRMSKLALLASENPSRSDQELAKNFGYGSPFASAYRSWLHKCGISEMRKPFRLTAFGKIILSRDQFFQSNATKWFLHHELTSDPNRAEAWNFFMNDFRPNHPIFTKDVLKKSLMTKLMQHDMQHFGPESKMNPIIVRKLLDCYTSADALGALELLKLLPDGSYQFVERKPLGPWNSPNELEEEILLG